MKNNNSNSDIAAVNAEVHRLQNEAAKNPDHWINYGLKNHFAEELQKLEQLKKLNLK
jgi:hypothetical protein